VCVCGCGCGCGCMPACMWVHVHLQCLIIKSTGVHGRCDRREGELKTHENATIRRWDLQGFELWHGAGDTRSSKLPFTQVRC